MVNGKKRNLYNPCLKDNRPVTKTTDISVSMNMDLSVCGKEIIYLIKKGKRLRTNHDAIYECKACNQNGLFKGVFWRIIKLKNFLVMLVPWRNCLSLNDTLQYAHTFLGDAMTDGRKKCVIRSQVPWNTVSIFRMILLCQTEIYYWLKSCWIRVFYYNVYSLLKSNP